MLQGGENLPFLQETVAEHRLIRIVSEQLDGDLLADLSIDAIGQKDRARAATAKEAHQPVRAAATALLLGVAGFHQTGPYSADTRGHRQPRLRIVSQERLDFRTDMRGHAVLLEVTLTLDRRQVRRFAEQERDFVVHRGVARTDSIL